MIGINSTKTLAIKQKALLTELSSTVKTLRERGLSFTINDTVCYQKCRDEDKMALEGIIKSMEDKNLTEWANYRMFDENYMSCWTIPTYEEIVEIYNTCWDWISITLYAEIRRIEEEILALTIDDIDGYTISLEV